MYGKCDDITDLFKYKIPAVLLYFAHLEQMLCRNQEYYPFTFIVIDFVFFLLTNFFPLCWFADSSQYWSIYGAKNMENCL